MQERKVKKNVKKKRDKKIKKRGIRSARAWVLSGGQG